MKLLDIFVSNDSEKLLKLLPVLFSTILQCKQIMPERQNLQPLTPSKATTLRLTTFWLGPLSQALACLIFQQKPTKSWSGVVQASWGIFRKRFNQETRWSVSFTAIFPHLVLGGYNMKKSRTSTSTVHLPTTVILWTALNNPSITTTREQRRSTRIWDKTRLFPSVSVVHSQSWVMLLLSTFIETQWSKWSGTLSTVPQIRGKPLKSFGW